MSDCKTLEETSLLEPFDFDDLQPISIPVKYKGQLYTLREPTAGAAATWRNAALRGTKMVDGKPVAFDGVADTDALLVSLCLYDKDGKAVPLPTVKSWEHKVVEQLADRAKKIGELNQRDSIEDLEKRIANDQKKLARLKLKLEAGEPVEEPEKKRAKRYDGYFRLAQDRGRFLYEVMGWDGPLTHRQFITESAWLRQQWDVPDKHDWYEMQTAYVTAKSSAGKKGRGIRLDQFKLEFKEQQDASGGYEEYLTEEQATEAAKKRWFAIAGKPVNVDG